VLTVIVTQRGQLDAADEQRLLDARQTYEAAIEAATQEYRGLAVEMMRKSSIREVARVTGLSTNTLQRWKNEAALR
jgi:DNA invertase Pin-like site-specific DNA recombinase